MELTELTRMLLKLIPRRVALDFLKTISELWSSKKAETATHPVTKVESSMSRVLDNDLRRYARIFVGLGILMLNGAVIAQTPAPTPPTSIKSTAASDLNIELAKWTDLLDKLAIEARILSVEALRSEAMTSVADAYWEASPAKSRELFSSSLDLALLIEIERTRHAAITRLISTAAKRDVQLARGLTQILLDKKDRNDPALQASIDLLDFDPRTSEAIALASSSLGISADAAWLIFQLQKRDPGAADRVYSAYLNNANSRSLNRLLWLAGYPFGYGESLGGSTDPMQFTGISGFNFPTLKANRVLATAFLNIADQSILSTLSTANGATPQEAEALNSLVFFAVAHLLPEAEKYRPDLYQRWATLKNETSLRINPTHRDAILSKLTSILAERERVRTQTTDELDSSEEVLEQAEKLAIGCQRDAIYARAAFQFSYKKNFKRAMLIADKISALDLRDNVIQFVYYDMGVAGTAPESSINLDDALRYANRVESPELHALLLVKLAAFLSKNGDPGQVKQLLFDAKKLAEHIEKSSVRAGVLLAIERQLADSDADNRFELLRDAVSAVNRDKDIRIDQLSVQRRVNFGCQQDKPIWYGGGVARFNLIDSVLRFSNSREDAAVQLALSLDPGVNRIRALAAVAGSASKRVIAERDAKKKETTNRLK
jgi:hypothetical protein